MQAGEFHERKRKGSNILKSDLPLSMLIFIVALALRLFFVMNLPVQFQTLHADANDYDRLAVNLLAGKGYINHETGRATSGRAPLYPLFLSFIYFIFGHSYFAVRVIQCVMGALLCLVIFYIAKFAFNVKIALLSAAIAAFYKPFIYISFWGGPAFLLSENLFIFLFALFLLRLMNFFREPSLKNGILSGILLGLATLSRPLTALFPFIIFILLLIQGRHLFIERMSKALFLLACFILILLPWWIRNYSVHKAFVPLTTEGGFVFFAGNNPYVKGGGRCEIDSLLPLEERGRIGGMSEIAQDNLYRRQAMEFLRREYRKIPGLFLRKLIVLWDPYSTDYTENTDIKRTYNIWYAIILMFGFWGMVKSFTPKINIYILTLISVFLYFSGIAMLLNSEPRFRYPMEPYLLIFTAAGIYAIYKQKNILASIAAFAGVIGINILIYFKSDLILNLVRRFW